MISSLPNISKITEPATRNYRMRKYSKLNSDVVKLSIPENSELTYDIFGNSPDVFTKTINDLVLQSDGFDQSFFEELYFKGKLTIKYNEDLIIVTFKSNVLTNAQISNLSSSIKKIFSSSQTFNISFGNSKETELILLTKRFFKLNDLRINCSNCLKVNLENNFFNLFFFVNSSNSIISNNIDNLLSFYNDHGILNINISIEADNSWDETDTYSLSKPMNKYLSKSFNDLPPIITKPKAKNRKNLSDSDLTSLNRRSRRAVIVDGNFHDNLSHDAKFEETLISDFLSTPNNQSESKKQLKLEDVNKDI